MVGLVSRRAGGSLRSFCKFAGRVSDFPFEVRKLTPAAVKGYRSAVATTLKQFSSVDYSHQTILSNVIRSLELEKPKVSSPVPKWNLPWLWRFYPNIPLSLWIPVL